MRRTPFVSAKKGPDWDWFWTRTAAMLLGPIVVGSNNGRVGPRKISLKTDEYYIFLENGISLL
jgi:hypothetical protein